MPQHVDLRDDYQVVFDLWQEAKKARKRCEVKYDGCLYWCFGSCTRKGTCWPVSRMQRGLRKAAGAK